ncbi:TetR family transcriptional regulator [Ketogulonicigenium robustum]|uniref:TetR family transcriptional regulator n=1 Tax=Ketogulonicigenium robustum TaxID=92947 RepID=A0A1W6NW83_9RHOB|nr:TetR/AcrR family transcriptional regulator [Ketogulonicigenium robustum]ARO13518.1 TetR family transcriptional regulator [Ketogulonicigenium robustum]
MEQQHLTPKATATRLNIVKTGEALVQHKGFAALGLQEILKAAGVPKGSFYHYFPSKEAFGAALLADYNASYAARFDRLLSDPAEAGRSQLLRYLDAWITDPDDPQKSGWAEGCLVVKLSAEVADLSEDMRLVLSDGVGRLIARMAAMIRVGRQDGSLQDGPDADALAQVLYQMWLGAALLSKVTRSAAPMQGARAATLQLLACPAGPKTER